MSDPEKAMRKALEIDEKLRSLGMTPFDGAAIDFHRKKPTQPGGGIPERPGPSIRGSTISMPAQ